MNERTLKLIIVGEADVGKTCILNRWIHGTFTKDTAPTIGTGMTPIQMNVDEQTHAMHVWDTAGTPQYQSVVPLFSRDSDIALVVYDVTKTESFEKLNDWIRHVRENAEPYFIILGNKIDKCDERNVEKQVAEDFAKSVGAVYHEVSASTGEGFNEMKESIKDGVRETISEHLRNSIIHPQTSDYDECKC